MIMLLPNRYMNPKCYSVPNKESIFIRELTMFDREIDSLYTGSDT